MDKSEDQTPEDNERQLVRSPNGRWKTVSRRFSADEVRERMDRLALALHLTGNHGSHGH